MEIRGIDFNTAISEVQARYDKYMDRNQALVERQDDQANHMSAQLNSHFALLATLSLTVTGFLITQTTQNLTNPQRLLILIILSSETLSLFFGALDYRHTIKFHNKWAKTYYKMGKEIDEKLDSGELQFISDLRKIDTSYTSKIPRETRKVFSTLMITFCILGLVVLIGLFYAYFFDVPLWTN